jgi:hypothetical protein
VTIGVRAARPSNPCGVEKSVDRAMADAENVLSRHDAWMDAYRIFKRQRNRLHRGNVKGS